MSAAALAERAIVKYAHYLDLRSRPADAAILAVGAVAGDDPDDFQAALAAVRSYDPDAANLDAPAHKPGKMGAIWRLATTEGKIVPLALYETLAAANDAGGIATAAPKEASQPDEAAEIVGTPDDADARDGDAGGQVDGAQPAVGAGEAAPDALNEALVVARELARKAGDAGLVTALNGLAAGCVAAVDEPDAPEPPPIVSTDRLADLCSPPGLVGDIIDWMEQSSERPHRELLLAPALTLVSALAGRKFASPSNLRSNNYIVTLAPSGCGKNHGQMQIDLLVEEAGIGKYFDGSRLKSSSGLRKLIERKPTVGCIFDEMDGFLRQIHDPRNGHNSEIRADLLEYFSKAGGTFRGAEYADTPAQEIYNPNFSFCGATTPRAFWSSLTSASRTDGLLARFILLSVEGDEAPSRTPPLSPFEVPQPLIEAVKALDDAGGNFSTVNKKIRPHIVQLDAEASALDESMKVKLVAAAKGADEEAEPFVKRVREHALKLALTVACGVNPADPLITGPLLDWGYRLAHLSGATLIKEAGENIADNERERAFNRILRFISNAGGKGVTPGQIADKNRGIDARLRQQILDDLVRAGRVQFVRQASGGRPSERYFIA